MGDEKKKSNDLFKPNGVEMAIFLQISPAHSLVDSNV